MKVLVQRVNSTKLSVDGRLISEIGKGITLYFGVGKGDTEIMCATAAKKVANLRIFERDNDGKMNVSALDLGLEVLAVSQFTLYADCSHGNRPGFTNAEEPVRANELYELFVKELQDLGLTVKKGIFGADMQIEQFNDGPVSIILEF